MCLSLHWSWSRGKKGLPWEFLGQAQFQMGVVPEFILPILSPLLLSSKHNTKQNRITTTKLNRQFKVLPRCLVKWLQMLPGGTPFISRLQRILTDKLPRNKRSYWKKKKSLSRRGNKLHEMRVSRNNIAESDQWVEILELSVIEVKITMCGLLEEIE